MDIMHISDKAKDLLTGVTGVGLISAVEAANEFLIDTTIAAATGAAHLTDEITATGAAIIENPQNPVAIINALMQIGIAIVTFWKLIKKPVPRDENGNPVKKK